MKKQISEFQGMQYIVSYPHRYDKNEKYPIILFLHGAGSRGNDIKALLNNPYFCITDNFTDFPFITIAPLCHANTWFDIFETLQKFVYHCIKFDFADISKIYLIGASMGGYATWQLAMSLPECFSAIVPICGGGMYWNAGRLANLPVWAFHGKKDNVVLFEESVKMVDAVNKNGGNAKLTAYPENGHDAWSDTYMNKEVYEWMLSNKKQTKDLNRDLADTFNDNKLFG